MDHKDRRRSEDRGNYRAIGWLALLVIGAVAGAFIYHDQGDSESDGLQPVPTPPAPKLPIK